MTTSKLHFTQESVSKIIYPNTKNGVDFYNDTEEKGLFLIVRKSKVFYLRKTVNNKFRTFKLGKFPYMSVVEARNQAIKIKNASRQGIIAPANNQIIYDKPTELTFKGFFDKYIEEYCKLKHKRWEDTVAMMRRYGEHLYNMKISTITRADIQKTFNDISCRAKFGANNFLKLLSAMFNMAIKWDVLDKNPAQGIRKHPEKVRERYIETQEQLSKLIETIIAVATEVMADILLMLLFTGVMRSNVLSMKWQDINFENTTWSIPAKDTKNGKTQRVHLVKYALSILTKRKKENDSKSVWVFPSNRSKSGHITYPDGVWQKICALLGITDLRMHDLRRTHGSWMRKVGADREIIGEALGHKDKKSTEVYDIIAKEQVREFQDKATNQFEKVLDELGFFTGHEVTFPKKIKNITDNIETNNTIEALQTQIAAQQRMIEELMQQTRN